MEYQITAEDLRKCLEFAVKYHLDEKKLASNRITGQYRGLGGIIDSFVIGKLIEIGVSKIIENFTKDKICVLDFGIHELTKENRSDPDIIKIKENKKEREPNLFVEIKNISPDDRWIGLTAEQFETILKGKLAGKDPKKVILIYAYLFRKSGDLNLDPLGVYLKSKKIDEALFEKFCNIKDLYVKIQYALTGEELEKSGTEFNQGSYLYETDIIEELNDSQKDNILNNSKTYKKVSFGKGVLPVIMSDLKPEPKEYGKFTYEGDIEIYQKENYKNGELKSQRMFIYCKENTVIRNQVLGDFSLKKGKMYQCWFTTVGMNPSLKRNNIWIAQRNLQNVIGEKAEDRIKRVSKEI